MDTPRFSVGTNIAMKLPAARYDQTVAFYRDTLGLEVIEEAASASGMVSHSAKTTFGDCTLWFDCVDNYAHADIWLEVETNDLDAAVEHLANHGVHPQDELEPLPEDAPAHWISNPAGVPHILNVPSD